VWLAEGDIASLTKPQEKHPMDWGPVIWEATAQDLHTHSNAVERLRIGVTSPCYVNVEGPHLLTVSLVARCQGKWPLSQCFRQIKWLKSFHSKSYTNLLDITNLKDFTLFFLTFMQNISEQTHQKLTLFIIMPNGIKAITQDTWHT
jgi:hypothetical protein